MQIIQRVYHTINIHAQKEFRFSYSDPPLAQIPEDLEHVYKPDSDWPWLSWDWDQAEPRLLAALCQDSQLQREIDEHWDRPTILTCEIFRLPVPPTFVDPHNSPECHDWRQEVGWHGKKDKRRRAGKTCGLRLNYGGDPYRAHLSPGFRALGIRKSAVVGGALRYLARYPKMLSWQRQQAQYGLQHKEVIDWMGGRWPLLTRDVGKLKRQAINGPCQIGVSRLHNQVFVEVLDKCSWDEVRFVFGGHDAQTWAIREDTRDRNMVLIKEIVERPRNIQGTLTQFPAVFKEREKED